MLLGVALSATLLPAQSMRGARDAATPVSPALSQPSALTPFQRQKAETLLQDGLSCLGCHRFRGKGGMLAPALDDVRARRDPAYIAAIVADPARTRPGVLMPRARMPLRDRALIIRYFGGDPAAGYTTSGATGASLPPSGETDPARLYATWCAGCHGGAGQGNGPNAKFLPVAPARHADASLTGMRSDDWLFDMIAGGGAIMNRSARMPAFGGSLSPSDMRGLVRYIRSLCRCEGPAWSRGQDT